MVKSVWNGMGNGKHFYVRKVHISELTQTYEQRREQTYY